MLAFFSTEMKTAVTACANGMVFRSRRGGLAKYGLSALSTLGAVAAYIVVVQLLVGGLRR
jgi:hypothetical protein